MLSWKAGKGNERSPGSACDTGKSLAKGLPLHVIRVPKEKYKVNGKRDLRPRFWSASNDSHHSQGEHPDATLNYTRGLIIAPPVFETLKELY